MKPTTLLSLSFLLLTLFITGCRPDTIDEGPQLTGHWEIEEAKRNGRPTESLIGLYFTFTPDGEFLTNVSGDDEKGRYERTGNTILTSEVMLPLQYEIVKLADSTLELSSVFQDYRFHFRLRRAADENMDHAG